MEERRNTVVHLEMKFSTAFVIGLGIALAALVVMVIPWIVMFVLVAPLSVAFAG